MIMILTKILIKDPMRSQEFVVSGENRVEFWEFNGNSVQRQHVVEIEEQQYRATITCMAYFNYSCEGTLRSDVIVGTSIGSIGVISGHNLYLIEGAYHSKMVNCIRVAKVDNQLVILTAGMDDLVKVFDSNFRILLTLNVRHKNRKTNTALAVQSLDIYTCSETNFLLLGLRCGEIVEHRINFLNVEGKKMRGGKNNMIKRKNTYDNEEKEQYESMIDAKDSLRKSDHKYAFENRGNHSRVSKKMKK